ncbi:hypothetical protein CQW23_25869 [Capsicum baccatum]|uniref:Uncharacterized protein n=1 Tax=Capsicum baccatum TaxID=33114 RepID=A0A2G2VM83_CAPBA|nr:hypothetical protein CQW23_25869 [Capsicum baccatum]
MDGNYQGLRSEVGNLGIVMKKIQDAVSGMSEEDRKTFTSLVEGQEECLSVSQSEKLRMPDIVQFTSKDSHLKSSMIEESTASPSVQEDSIKSPLNKDDKINCYVSEVSTSVLRQSSSTIVKILNLRILQLFNCSLFVLPHRQLAQCDADNASASAATAKVNFENKLLSRLPVDGSFQVTIFMWILTIVLRAIAQELGLLSAPPMDSDCGFPCHENECS